MDFLNYVHHIAQIHHIDKIHKICGGSPHIPILHYFPLPFLTKALICWTTPPNENPGSTPASIHQKSNILLKSIKYLPNLQRFSFQPPPPITILHEVRVK